MNLRMRKLCVSILLRLLAVVIVVVLADGGSCFRQSIRETTSSSPSASFAFIRGGPPIIARTGNNSCRSKSKICRNMKVDPPLSKAPIYITIGPQCAGKTTKLSHIFSSQPPASVSVVAVNGTTSMMKRDVCLDDREGVYMSVPTRLFLVGCVHRRDERDEEEDAVIFGKSVSDRIREPSNEEMKWVLRRLCHRITPKRFRSKFEGQQQLLVEVVERYCSTHAKLERDAVQLFVPEALFDRSVTTGFTGIESTIHQLSLLASIHTNDDVSLAWGNTNTRPREYEAALHIAQRSQRPVIFLFLPTCSVRELLHRNIVRFCQTGKYVPTSTILRAHSDASRLRASAITELKRLFPRNHHNHHHSSWHFDVALSKLAGYDMHPNRTVTKLTTTT